MNPGPVEEAGKVAGGIVDALKQQPFTLASTIINIGLIGLMFWLLYYVGEKTSAAREREIKMLYENQKNIQEILSRCIVPDKTGMKLQSDESHSVELPPLRNPLQKE
jgi:hypothetical protein